MTIFMVTEMKSGKLKVEMKEETVKKLLNRIKVRGLIPCLGAHAALRRSDPQRRGWNRQLALHIYIGR